MAKLGGNERLSHGGKVAGGESRRGRGPWTERAA